MHLQLGDLKSILSIKFAKWKINHFNCRLITISTNAEVKTQYFIHFILHSKENVILLKLTYLFSWTATGTESCSKAQQSVLQSLNHWPKPAFFNHFDILHRSSHQVTVIPAPPISRDVKISDKWRLLHWLSHYNGTWQDMRNRILGSKWTVSSCRWCVGRGKYGQT